MVWEDTHSSNLDDYCKIEKEDAEKMSSERLQEIYDMMDFYMTRPDDYITLDMHNAFHKITTEYLKPELEKRGLLK